MTKRRSTWVYKAGLVVCALWIVPVGAWSTPLKMVGPDSWVTVLETGSRRPTGLWVIDHLRSNLGIDEPVGDRNEAWGAALDACVSNGTLTRVSLGSKWTFDCVREPAKRGDPLTPER